MSSIKWVLLALLLLVSVIFIIRWSAAVLVRPRSGDAIDDAQTARAPQIAYIAIGFVTNFFDTFGIGSFATTTAAFKLFRMVPDEVLPGTLLVGHSLPTVAQAFIFVNVISVDPGTLAVLIATSVVGAWWGAGVVSGWPRRAIQIGMGIALLVATGLMLLANLGLLPGAGTALYLVGPRLAVAVVVTCLIGALLSLGVGSYGPSLVLFSLLGMDPRAAFPIMMGSGAFQAQAAGMRFISRRRYHLRGALGLACGGIPAVLIAALIVKSLPIGAVRWIIACVVFYSSIAMLRSAYLEQSLAKEKE